MKLACNNASDGTNNNTSFGWIAMEILSTLTAVDEVDNAFATSLDAIHVSTAIYEQSTMSTTAADIVG